MRRTLGHLSKTHLSIIQNSKLQAVFLNHTPAAQSVGSTIEPEASISDFGFRVRGMCLQVDRGLDN